LHNQHQSNHYLRFLFYLLWLAGWHFSQVTTLGIQHADGKNATNGTPSFLQQVGADIDFPRNYPESTMWVLGKEEGQDQGAPTTKPGLGHAGLITMEQQGFGHYQRG
jgi:hypothetical protein